MKSDSSVLFPIGHPVYVPLYFRHMEIAAFIAVCERFSAVKPSAFIAVVPFIHIAQAGNKFKAVFTLSKLADTALSVGVIKLVHALLIVKPPVKLIL